MSDINAAKKVSARSRRHRRVRAKVHGTAQRPRLCVFRSLKHFSAQVIDDDAGKTLAAVSDRELDDKTLKKLQKGEDGRKSKTAVAFALGKLVAEKAKAAKITTVVFDRGGFSYKGRIAAFADGARENGLEF
ncbi:MAG: 50S ribosomal protein L18 [Patescibacteria group bacterium]|nr:50S ribosomal protein L18 [Patescibacteria group bacterium]